MATLIQKRPEYRLKSVISIEPYVDPEYKNMGLERYGMSGFPGGGEVEDLGSITIGNKTTYLTGLDENAEYIRKIEDDAEKAAKIKEIKEVITYLEEECGLGKDTLKPDNHTFWSKLQLSLENNKRLDLNMKDPTDILIYYAIKGGGFSNVAPLSGIFKNLLKLLLSKLRLRKSEMKLKPNLMSCLKRIKNNYSMLLKWF
jgi:hypothetical protein